MRPAYSLFIFLYASFLRVAALFHPKARLWVEGRRDWRRRYRIDFQKKKPVLWVHVASLGEFEQGRPVIEAFRERRPDWQVVLSFFSPSGYEIRKNYPQADFICYLPADTPQNARDFLELIQPDAAIFVKYEFWANYLFELKKRGIPTLLVSALFRESQPFFRWYGGLWRRMLDSFSHIFVQNQASAVLLHRLGLQEVTLAGDTRVDRVLKIAAAAPENPVVAAFAAGAGEILVAGSSWEADEAVFLSVLQQNAGAMKCILAPHEPTATHVQRLLERMPGALPYSLATPQTAAQADVLIIDNIGMLNTLYRYGSLAYIGGGFGKGIHNTLEPAAWGLPILFGPKYEKFEEARQLVARGGAFAVHDAAAMAAVLKRLEAREFYAKAVDAVRLYLEESRGATRQIMSYLESIL